MENQHVINGLLRKRAELAGLVEHHQAEVAKLVADIAAVEASILLFAPNHRLDAIMPKPLPVQYPAMRGEITSLALTLLREADEPVSTHGLNTRIMAARNISAADEHLTKKMYWRLHSCLRNHRKHGRVRSIKSADGKYSLWEIAR